MNTIVCLLDKDNIDMEMIAQGADIIKKGGLVVFPTETVYGIGANALSSEACNKIFLAKGRPSDNPLIVHVSSKSMLNNCIGEKLDERTTKLIDRFWPGPLTIILKKSEKIPSSVTGGLDTVALRMPGDQVALSLINRSGLPIAAPSANLSGKPSTTTFEHVINDMEGRVDMILGGYDSQIGLESTIIDMTVSTPTILRPGGITIEELRELLPEVMLGGGLITEKETPKAPGMKYKHYAPAAPLYLVNGKQEAVVAKIKELAERSRKEGKKVGILLCEETKCLYCSSQIEKKNFADEGDCILSMGSKNDLQQVAKTIFKALREFDDLKTDIIFSESVEEHDLGLAVMNRMKKAAGFKIIEV